MIRLVFSIGFILIDIFLYIFISLSISLCDVIAISKRFCLYSKCSKIANIYIIGDYLLFLLSCMKNYYYILSMRLSMLILPTSSNNYTYIFYLKYKVATFLSSSYFRLKRDGNTLVLVFMS